MIIYPSGTVLATKVDENNNFREEPLTASDLNAVSVTGTENITGQKTFTIAPLVPTPTSSGQAVNKSYVDNLITPAGANFDGGTPDSVPVSGAGIDGGTV